MPSEQHRLHYRWSQLEADCTGINLGSPITPLPHADRELKLHCDCQYKTWPCGRSWACPVEMEQFSYISNKYKTADYNTFAQSGVLKLTEVEIFFLSLNMTRTSSSEWAVVYLGIGCGDRFRYLRDEFFPGLYVIGFDPYEDSPYSSPHEDGPYYTANRTAALRNAELWNNDGTGFIFHVRCFEIEQDVDLILQQTKGRKLLLISDIRGRALLENGRMDKLHDLNLQWDAIKRLHPVSSLLKFDAPNMAEQFFDYAPGVILKQVFCNYLTREVRLMVDGVPQQSKRYNSWELCKKMKFHHENVRGQVYAMPRRPHTECLDSCFDCSVLWNTVLTYASQNNVCPDKVLKNIVNSQVYIPGDYPEYGWDRFKWIPPSLSQRWSDVQWYLQHGLLTEAIAGLEAEGEQEDKEVDWTRIAEGLFADQSSLAHRLNAISNEVGDKEPLSRASLIRLLGSLSKPFTLVKTPLNGLLEDSYYK